MAEPVSAAVEIRPLQSAEDAEWAARLMASTEPWLTLRRSYEDSLAIVRDPTREVHVAVADRRRLGFMILVMQGAFVGYLQTVCVAPEARGRGIGTRLVAAAEERIFRESPNVFLCVSSFNHGARRLYERLGYEVVGTLAGYIVPEHDEILLRKSRGPLRGSRKPPG